MTDSIETLNFELLDKKISEYRESSYDKPAGKVEKTAFAAALVGSAMGLFVAGLFSDEVALYLVRIGLLVQVVAGLVLIVLMLKRKWPKIRNANRDFSLELDNDFEKYIALVRSLRRFPSADRIARLNFIRDRKANMTYRLGLVLGGFDKLGLIPVFIALYFQFKDWRWGDWPELSNASIVPGFFIWMIFATYVLGWFFILLKTRLDTYECLLAESIQDCEK